MADKKKRCYCGASMSEVTSLCPFKCPPKLKAPHKRAMQLQKALRKNDSRDTRIGITPEMASQGIAKFDPVYQHYRELSQKRRLRRDALAEQTTEAAAAQIAADVATPDSSSNAA